MSAQISTETLHRERIWKLIDSSISIKKHVDFFRWLQDEVHPFVPHDVLVAVWGDFACGHLNYDVASNIPEIGTRQIRNGCDVDPLMSDLYQRWLDTGEKWYVLNNFLSIGPDKIKGNTCADTLGQMKSILVHGIRDRRGMNDCLYVFLDKDHRPDSQHQVLDLLLPQIDTVLRRVECLVSESPNAAEMAKAREFGISGREHEIMHWVRLGKSNHEIGMILSISPNTVKNHLKRVFQKLDVSSRAQAVAIYPHMARAN